VAKLFKRAAAVMSFDCHENGPDETSHDACWSRIKRSPGMPRLDVAGCETKQRNPGPIEPPIETVETRHAKQDVIDDQKKELEDDLVKGL
jgi:hypothetical protein